MSLRELLAEEELQTGDWVYIYGTKDRFVRQKLRVRQILEQIQRSSTKQGDRVVEFISAGGGLHYLDQRKRKVRFFREE